MREVVLGFLIALLAFTFFMLHKNDVTCRNQLIITGAIYRYRMHTLEQGSHIFLVGYSDMESYESTLWRLWDFGYENILPKHLYEVIRPFIEEERKK